MYIYICIYTCRKTGNEYVDTIRRIAYNNYQGLDYFQNIISFKGTRVNITSYLPITKHAFTLMNSTNLKILEMSVCVELLTD